MFNRKVFTVILVVAVAGLVLAACMRNDAAENESPAVPGVTPNYQPQNTSGAMNNSADGSDATRSDGVSGATETDNPGDTSTSADGALTPFDWANRVSEIEAAIAQISEISQARVVVTGSTALAGVKFDNAYKGEMTERIREMVAAEVLRADPSIQTVAVTSEPGDVDKVYAIADEIRSGRSADELAADINAIVRNATTMR